MNNKLNLQTCCICLEEQTEFDIENYNRLIEYNHCGSYYVHNKCLDTWKLNECLICRKKIYENQSRNQSTNESTNESTNQSTNQSTNESTYESTNQSTTESTTDIITIMVDPTNRSLHVKQFCFNFCIITNLLGIGLYFLITNYK